MSLAIQNDRRSASGDDSNLDFAKLDPGVRKKLRELCKVDNYHAPLALLFDYLVIAVSVYLSVGVSYFFYPISILLIGSTQRALVNVLHESSHKVLAKNGRWNVTLGTIFSGYLVLHMYNPYRNSHIGFHHRFLGDPEKDPDYNFHVGVGIYDHRVSDKRFFLKNIAMAVLGFRTLEYVNYVVRDRVLFKPENVSVSMPIRLRTERVAMLAQWATIVGVCAWMGWLWYLLFFWFVPLFTVAIAIGWLSELAEHYPLPESESKQVLMTRNRHGWTIERFLLGRHNDNYHLVHHLNTGVPFWNMKRAHHVLLTDPSYSRWDGLWAGILTRSPGRKNQETLVSYASKYRQFCRDGGDPSNVDGGGTFAEAAALARAMGT
ncbi:fatty acid desaturase family protein [Streptomyces sp. H39-S7]|uniref:fatty acid desaturase family protein n=1 Tax=Streptomyces sp. H39-S7 TaxID=3004357 RepID=UPI0022AF6F3C|nr:fatty acid desaturase family protein [Streptomyces sp. H39-S7]MCZ4125230.1 fatty acid desaturase family protein [Streptomyces sp. H39-S7]